MAWSLQHPDVRKGQTMSKLTEIESEWLAGITGGRQSSSSKEEIKTLLKSTDEAIKDLARNQNSTSSSDQMMPLMMVMMMRR